MKWRRQRDAQPGLSERELVDTWQVVSLLLDYPDAVLVQRVPMLRSVVATLPDAQRDPLVEVLDTLERADLRELQSDYVDTFDVTRKCSLHLTYFTQGDTRQSRGGARRVQAGLPQGRRRVRHRRRASRPPLRGARVRRRAGLGHRVAPAQPAPGRHRGAAGRSRTARRRRGCRPWRRCARPCPSSTATTRPCSMRLVAEGPPQEEVGLEPYAIDPRLNPRPDPVDTTAMLGPTIPVGAPR